MEQHESLLYVTHSFFTGIYSGGALSFGNLLYSILIKYCSFTECQNSENGGGAIRISSVSWKNCTFCCFTKCSTKLKSNDNDLGQALFFSNGMSCIVLISICMCPESNDSNNLGPIYLSCENNILNFINETKSKCVGRCAIHNQGIQSLLFKYSSVIENFNEVQSMFYEIDGSFDISYCNIIRNKNNQVIMTKGIISNSCILDNDNNALPEGSDRGGNTKTEIEIELLNNCIFTFPPSFTPTSPTKTHTIVILSIHLLFIQDNIYLT